jgi:hypothetical protein
MSQGPHAGRIESPRPEIAAIAKQRIEEFAELQTGLLAHFHAIGSFPCVRIEAMAKS